MSISNAILYIYPGIDLRVNVRVENDGAGEKIGFWGDPRPQPTIAELAAAELPAAKDQRIAAINAECRSRLLARFGDAAEQVSRSLGIYGATEKAAMETGIASTIDASNTASDAVLAAADIAAVEAVTVAWPVI